MEESITFLFTKFLDDRCSEAEIKELLAYFKIDANEELLKLVIINEMEKLKEPSISDEEIALDLDKVFVKTQEQIYSSERGSSSQNKFKIWPSLIAAASIVVVIGIGQYFLSQKQPVVLPEKTLAKQVLPPTNAKAYLTLANGEKISLTDAATGNIAKESGTIISKISDGALAYRNKQTVEDVTSVGYNILEIPKGGQYRVVLPDGTTVWMNAASTLKYPSSFSKLKQRRVELSGEAYFQVAKDKTNPFIVKTNLQEIEVLGTVFNVNAYPNEIIRTTLLEGSVKINSRRTGQTPKNIILAPGQVAINAREHINIKEANVKNDIAWKNGYFVFSNKSLEDIMKEISRWYDVEVEYRGDLSKITIGGSMSRLDSIEELLRKIALTGSIQFKITGRRVIISS